MTLPTSGNSSVVASDNASKAINFLVVRNPQDQRSYSINVHLFEWTVGYNTLKDLVEKNALRKMNAHKKHVEGKLCIDFINNNYCEMKAMCNKLHVPYETKSKWRDWKSKGQSCSKKSPHQSPLTSFSGSPSFQASPVPFDHSWCISPFLQLDAHLGVVEHWQMYCGKPRSVHTAEYANQCVHPEFFVNNFPCGNIFSYCRYPTCHSPSLIRMEYSADYSQHLSNRSVLGLTTIFSENIPLPAPLVPPESPKITHTQSFRHSPYSDCPKTQIYEHRAMGQISCEYDQAEMLFLSKLN